MNLNRYRVLGYEKGYSRQPLNKAFLVILQMPKHPRNFLEQSLREMEGLARAADIRVAGTCLARLSHPSPSHFVREGKLDEIRETALSAGANVLLFNVEMSPTQSANIEKFSGIPAVDRTGLILEIFGRRARSREGKLQVELAQLQYALPRLGGLGLVMSRPGGGVGTRGPGEQELENDRRKVRRRIRDLELEIEKVREHRGRLRQSRKRKHFVTAAIVGYTNAGKTELLNALTGARAQVEDKMFATLDPIIRVENRDPGRDLLLVDTVGFLRDLPHALVESFRATLEEAGEADMLIHVLDVSSPQSAEMYGAALKVLQEIGAEEKPYVLALNKADLLGSAERERAAEKWQEGILISAKDRRGLDALLLKVRDLSASLRDKSVKPGEENNRAL